MKTTYLPIVLNQSLELNVGKNSMDVQAPLCDDDHTNNSSSNTVQWAEISTISKIPTTNHDGKISMMSMKDVVIRPILLKMHIASHSMELGSESRFTGLVLFHRYVRHFNKLLLQEQQHHMQNDMHQITSHLGKVAAACLFLGCKMEEEPRRIRDVINLSHVLNFCSSSVENDTTATSTSDKQREALQNIPTIIESLNPPPLDEQYWKNKEEMVSIEQHVLRMIRYNTTVCHPYRCILIIMETLGFGVGNKDTTSSSSNTKWLLTPQQSDNLILRSYRILNEIALDPGGSTLQYPVLVLSCAAIVLASSWPEIVRGVHCKEDKDDNEETLVLPNNWWRALDVSTSELDMARTSIKKLLTMGR